VRGEILTVTPGGPDFGQMEILTSATGFFSPGEHIVDTLGGDGFSLNYSYSAVVEYRQWFEKAPMLNRRFNHSSLETTSGKIVVVGGNNDIGGPVKDIEIYDQLTDTWTLIPGVSLDYAGQTVPFTVGNYVWGDNSLAFAKIVVDTNAGATGTLKIANVHGTFINAENLSDLNHLYTGETQAFVLTETVTGDVSGATGVVIGNIRDGAGNGILLLAFASGPFTPGENLTGDVGGFAVLGTITGTPGDGQTSADPVDLIREHVKVPLVELSDGRVLIVSGAAFAGNGAVDILNSALTTVSAGPDIPTSRIRHTIHKFGDGQVGVFGGEDTTTAALSDVQLFDPGTDTWSAVSPMGTARAGHVSVLLPNNTILVLGGEDKSTSTVLSSAEISGP
jgi:hypothetical protein